MSQPDKKICRRDGARSFF